MVATRHRRSFASSAALRRKTGLAHSTTTRGSRKVRHHAGDYRDALAKSNEVVVLGHEIFGGFNVGAEIRKPWTEAFSTLSMRERYGMSIGIRSVASASDYIQAGSIVIPPRRGELRLALACSSNPVELEIGLSSILLVLRLE